MGKPTLFAALIMFVGVATVEATVFTLVNKCKETVWPGILPGDQMQDGGFSLGPAESKTLYPPTKWSGRLWGRTGCTFDASGKGSCQTGDCGGVLQCNGAGGDPPVSLVELTLDSSNGGLDFYDVSLVDGYNLPVSVQPVKGTGNCTVAGDCNGDLRDICPSELAVKVDDKVVACKSACESFKTPQYCCTGAYANAQTCQATKYSKIFKKVCPTSYSYAFDDRSSLCKCTGADYTIVFCPAQKSGDRKSVV